MRSRSRTAFSMMRSTMRSAIASARCGTGLPRSARHLVGVLLLVGEELRVQRLRQLGAVAVERVGLQRQPPGEHVGVLAVLDRGVVRHVDGLGDRAGDERLRRRHHADVALDREVALADPAAGVGAVEHRIVLGLQVRRAFHRHRAAAEGGWRPRCPSWRSRGGSAGRKPGRRGSARASAEHVASGSPRRASIC